MDLPDDLALPLASGASWWYWLGGRPAIDFVNTRRERWWRNVETLVTPDDLSLWLQQAGLLQQPTAVPGAQLQSARRLRDAISAAVQAAIDRVPTCPGAVSEINQWLTHSPGTQGLETGRDGVLVLRAVPPTDPVQHALARLALDAAIVLGSDQRGRLRVCASETCSARFYDASRAATRRWCSMSGCGNTAKARRHRTRYQASARPSGPSPDDGE